MKYRVTFWALALFAYVITIIAFEEYEKVAPLDLLQRWGAALFMAIVGVFLAVKYNQAYTKSDAQRDAKILAVSRKIAGILLVLSLIVLLFTFLLEK